MIRVQTDQKATVRWQRYRQILITAFRGYIEPVIIVEPDNDLRQHIYIFAPRPAAELDQPQRRMRILAWQTSEFGLGIDTIVDLVDDRGSK